MQFLLPLLALPWLGRVLGPESFGLLMYMCLLPPLVALFMDWGLAAAGARKAARLRGKNDDLSRLLGAALCAKAILASACVLISVALWPLLPHASEHPEAYWLAILAGMGRGLAPVWFYQGTASDMPIMAAWDTLASIAALAMVFIFVRDPGQWPLYLLFLAAARFLANGAMTLRLCLRYAPIFNLDSAIRLLKHSSVLAASALATMFCQNGAQIGLGFFLGADSMGILVAINKMLRSLTACLNPISQTLFPEYCIDAAKKQAASARPLKWSLLLVLACASLAAVLVWLLAPLLTRIALGPEYPEAAKALRITIFAAPCMALNYALANQVLTPFGLERKMLAVQTGCALLCLPEAAILGIGWNLYGGACLPVLIEAGLLAGLALVAWRGIRWCS